MLKKKKLPHLLKILKRCQNYTLINTFFRWFRWKAQSFLFNIIIITLLFGLFFFSAAKESPLPVMVWIHGGAFVLGSSWGANLFDNWLYDLESMVRHGNLIGVSLNYRMGPLGCYKLFVTKSVLKSIRALTLNAFFSI